MIRTPHEPDNGLFLPLGDKVTKPENKPRVAPPFTEYTPIKGRPGWEDDGHGHKRYNGLPDAMKHEKDVENKRCGLHLAQLEQHTLETLHAFDAQMDAQALPGDETHAQLQANVLRNTDVDGSGRLGRALEAVDDEHDARRRKRHECLPHNVWLQAHREELTPVPIHLVQHFHPDSAVHGFECSDGKVFYTQPIPGGTVSTHAALDGGLGPLIDYGTAVLHEDVRKYLRELRAVMPADVPLFVRGHECKIRVWGTAEYLDPPRVPIIRG